MDGNKPRIELLSSGVPGLDTVLGGGFPKRSLNIITGGPGTGKTILALQIAFSQAHQANKAIYFVSIAEPSLKFLRYMQQFDFFDPGLVGKVFSIADLSEPAFNRGLEGVIDVLRRETAEREPGVIVVDSFKAITDRLRDPEAVRALLYPFNVQMAVEGVTTFLVGEYDEDEMLHLPEFFAADGIIRLALVYDGLRASRQLDMVKLRGTRSLLGKHFFEINSAGIRVYPRVSVPTEHGIARLEAAALPKLATGVSGLDGMLGGGLPARSTTLIEGGTGTGKTLLTLSFIIEGARRGEPGLFFTMDETREQTLEEAAVRGWNLLELEQRGLLRVVYASPVEVAGDILLQQLRDHVSELGARRAAIDSISSLKMGIAAKDRYEELLYSIGKTFRREDVTTVLTADVEELVGSAVLTGREVSPMTDNIIKLRYVEIAARMTRALTVIKVRGSGHDTTLRELVITDQAIEVGRPFTEYRGVLTGVPTPSEEQAMARPRRRPAAPGS